MLKPVARIPKSFAALLIIFRRFQQNYFQICVQQNFRSLSKSFFPCRIRLVLSVLFTFSCLKNAIALMVTAANLLLLRATRHYDHVCREDPHLPLPSYLRCSNSDSLQRDPFDGHFYRARRSVAAQSDTLKVLKRNHRRKSISRNRTSGIDRHAVYGETGASPTTGPL